MFISTKTGIGVLTPKARRVLFGHILDLLKTLPDRTQDFDISFYPIWGDQHINARVDGVRAKINIGLHKIEIEFGDPHLYQIEVGGCTGSCRLKAGIGSKEYISDRLTPLLLTIAFEELERDNLDSELRKALKRFLQDPKMKEERDRQGVVA